MGQLSEVGGTVRPCDDAVDGLIAEVEDALERLDCAEADELTPSAAEAVLALLGCTDGLREGPWIGLASRLRAMMAKERGIACGSC